MKWFSRQKLNIKFTVVIGAFLCIPIVAIYVLLFGNMKKTTVSQLTEFTSEEMRQTYNEIQKTVDLCNMSTQMFLNNQSLSAFLIHLKQGDDISTEELVEFHQNDVAMLERLVNSNPDLYRIRVYAENDDFPEMMPILFHHQRMRELSWAESYESGQWQLDYQDNVSVGASARSAEHVMSLVTDIQDYELGRIGVLEVAVDMSAIFPQMFDNAEDDWACFLDENGRLYSEADDAKEAWVKEKFDKKLSEYDAEPEYYEQLEIDGSRYILGILPVKELSGYLIHMVGVEKELQAIDHERNVSLGILLAVFIVAMLLINWIVKALLKGFYEILGTIRQVQEGDLEAVAPEVGNDEVGELGHQINKMLYRIRSLIEENVNRELLMKNSEIRALQNQINAHFIYNVLESIKMMAEIKEEFDISDAVTSLGRLLRYSMRWVSQEVTVREEIQYIRDYLDLINLRFDYEINLSLKISDFIYAQKIPKMSLQPIIENAIVHGIEELAEDASIYIKAREYDDYFVLDITDSGKGMTDEQVKELEKKIAGEIEVNGGSGNGIGLKNVQDRIRISFGDAYGLGVVSREGCFTKVTVTIPYTVKSGNVLEKATGVREEKRHEEPADR